MDTEQLRQSGLHILFLPLMASGHIIPTLDIANLFAQRGVRCTVVTTAAYADVINSAIKNTPSVKVHLVPLPSSVDTKGGDIAFICSLHHLRPSIQFILRELRPTAVVADIFFPCATALCADLGIPRLLFSGNSTFSRCAVATVYNGNFSELPSSEKSGADQVVVLEGLPHMIQMLKTQLPSFESVPPPLQTLLNEMKEAEEGSFGELFNSFLELEPEYTRHIKEVMGRRAWFIGPVSLCNDTGDLSTRGAPDTAASTNRLCQEWLDSKPARSVLYICFGSLLPISNSQLLEISMALESTKRPFIWVVRQKAADKSSLPWLSDAIAHREKAGDCLIIRGWAPQVLILNHASAGGFITHCGWNSLLESISAGVPMATWPLFADQFYNERLIVDVLKVGVAVGSKHFAFEADKRPKIAAADVEVTIELLMGNREEAESRRQRAKELATAAKRAVMEGGSSFSDINILIKELETQKTVGITALQDIH